MIEFKNEAECQEFAERIQPPSFIEWNECKMQYYESENLLSFTFQQDGEVKSEQSYFECKLYFKIGSYFDSSLFVIYNQA